VRAWKVSGSEMGVNTSFSCNGPLAEVGTFMYTEHCIASLFGNCWAGWDQQQSCGLESDYDTSSYTTPTCTRSRIPANQLWGVESDGFIVDFSGREASGDFFAQVQF
jgi:hypothetical protein